MKKTIAVLLVLVFALLCGCDAESDRVSDDNAAQGTTWCLTGVRMYDSEGVNVMHMEYEYDAAGNLIYEGFDVGSYSYTEWEERLETYATYYLYVDVDGTMDQEAAYSYDKNNNILGDAHDYAPQSCRYTYNGQYITEWMRADSESPFLKCEYDQLGRLIKKEHGVEHVHGRCFYYNKENRIEKIENYERGLDWERLNEVYQFEYDKQGNLAELSRFDVDNGALEERVRVEVVRNDGVVKKLLFWREDELIESVEFEYDDNGNIVKATVQGDDKMVYAFEYEEIELSPTDRERYIRSSTINGYLYLFEFDVLPYGPWGIRWTEKY